MIKQRIVEMERFRKEKKPEYKLKVVKQNDLIQKARYDLSLNEQKVLSYLISKLTKETVEFPLYRFDIQKFCSLLGIQNNGNNYRYLRDTIKSLADKSFWFKTETGRTRLCRFISYAEFIDETETMTLEIKLDDALAPYLLQLKGQFTEYELSNVLVFKSKYSLRLYEIIVSYRLLEYFEIELDELREILQVKGYEKFSDFRKNVLDLAVGEINEWTHLHVWYETIRRGRRVAVLRFEIEIMYDDVEVMDHIREEKLGLENKLYK